MNPSLDYVAGYRQALSDAMRCGAYNDAEPPRSYAACIKPDFHTGMHDDGWRLWGDANATGEESYQDALATRRALRGTPVVRDLPDPTITGG